MFRMSKAIVVLLLSAASAQGGLSKLEALSMIESGNNDAAVGSRGEVSRFQIKPNIWREYSSTRAWRDVRISAAVAQEYLAHLENTFRRRAGREPGDFDLYVLWNAGPSYYAKIGFSARRVHPLIRERAQRYVNLREMNNGVAASTKTVPVPRPVVVPTPAVAPVKVEQPAPPLVQTVPTRALPPIEPSGLAALMPGLTTVPVEPRASIPAGRGQSSLFGGGIRGR